MSNQNAIIGFHDPTIKDLQETIGVTQLGVNANEDSWFQTVGGLLIQGGRVNDVPGNAMVVVNFHRAYPKKVLGIWLQLIAAALAGAPQYRDFVNPISLTQFQLFNDYVDDSSFFWWAVGV